MSFAARSVITFAFLCLVFVSVYASCPPANQVRGPECRDDYDCRKGGPCCPNWLGKKSCVTTVAFNSNNSGKSRGRREILRTEPQNYGAGVYCDGVKCMPYEVCKTDRFTGKLRCQSP